MYCASMEDCCRPLVEPVPGVLVLAAAPALAAPPVETAPDDVGGLPFPAVLAEAAMINPRLEVDKI